MSLAMTYGVEGATVEVGKRGESRPFAPVVDMDMKPRANFWIEEEGEVVLSTWRVALLQAIADTGSITAGAERMNVPYRVAWQKVHEMEERLGKPLVETQTGGPGGGGARLTPAGEQYVKQFREFTKGLNDLVQRRYREVFQED